MAHYEIGFYQTQWKQNREVCEQYELHEVQISTVIAEKDPLRLVVSVPSAIPAGSRVRLVGQQDKQMPSKLASCEDFVRRYMLPEHTAAMNPEKTREFELGNAQSATLDFWSGLPARVTMLFLIKDPASATAKKGDVLKHVACGVQWVFERAP